MKKLLFLLALLSPSVALAQITEQRRIVTAYDLTSTSFIYCAMDNPITGTGSITTSGSSTTVTETTAADPDPFSNVSVGDVIDVVLGDGSHNERTVTARASSTSITVNSAITIPATGLGFSVQKLRCGTTATDGWIMVAGAGKKLWTFNMTTINGTSIDAKIECRNRNSTTSANVIVWPPSPAGTAPCGTGNFLDANDGAVCALADEWPWAACRVGLKLNTDTGAQSLTIDYSGSSQATK